jgi:hypothetical protein
MTDGLITLSLESLERSMTAAAAQWTRLCSLLNGYMRMLSSGEMLRLDDYTPSKYGDCSQPLHSMTRDAQRYVLIF